MLSRGDLLRRINFKQPEEIIMTLITGVDKRCQGSNLRIVKD